MPFCIHGEPDHKCVICQKTRRPDGLDLQGVPKIVVSPITPMPVLRPTAKAVLPSSTVVTKAVPTVVSKVIPTVAPTVVSIVVPTVVTPIPKVPPRSTLPGPPQSILVNGVAKQGPVSGGGLPVAVNPLVRGGGVKLNDLVVQDFWRTYKMLGVTDDSAEGAITAAIGHAGVDIVAGFDSLELAEKYALYKYTSVEYAKWNDFLRNKKGNYKSHCDLVSSALGKLSAEPAYATTYRIEKFSEGRHAPFFRRGTGTSGALIVGTTINFAAFSSTAFNVKVVEEDPQFSGAGSYVKYIISGHSGKRVNFLSTKSVECEILIDKGASFRITGGPDQKMVFDSARRSGAIEINIEQIV